MASKSGLKLILELQKNGRATYAEMASLLGISVSTAAAKTERLPREKIIEIKALPNPYEIGMIANAMIAIQAEPSKVDHICENLFPFPDETDVDRKINVPRSANYIPRASLINQIITKGG